MAETTMREAVAAFDDPEAAEARACAILSRHAAHDVHVHEVPAAE